MSMEMIRVLLVDDIVDTRENLKKLLFFEQDIEVVGSASSGEEGLELARRFHPHVVIMDINMPGMDGITTAQMMIREMPSIQIIMMSVQGEADYMRRSMLAGAREFLVKPPTVEQIVTSIRNVYELGKNFSALTAAPAVPAPTATQAPQPASAYTPAAPTMGASDGDGGQIIALFGTKGGVGTTSLAANLAIALRQIEPEARVALLDANSEFGDLSVLLNLSSERTVVDLISVEELEGQYVREVFIPHASGVRVMPGSGPAEAELVTNEQMERILRAVRPLFDYILVDTCATFKAPTLGVLDHADTILLVMSPDIPSIRNGRLFFDVTGELGYPREKIKLVLNKYEPQAGVTPAAIQGSIKHPIQATLPRDDRTTNSAIQQGLPFMSNKARTPLNQALLALAQHVATGGPAREGEAALPSGQAAAPPARPKKPSLFDRFRG